MTEATAGGGSVAVCTALDAGYLPLALVVATSIAASAAPGRRIAFHILYDGPDNWAVRRLQKWRNAAVEIILHRLPNPYDRYGTIGGFPPSTLFRFVAPEVLNHLDRAIYLDCDLIVEADLGELFDTHLDGKPLGAAQDLRLIDEALTTDPARAELQNGTRAYLSEMLGFETREAMLTYVQAGVAVLDLQKLRGIGYRERMEGTLERLGNQLRFADQCALNAAFVGDIAILDPRWNVMPEAIGNMWSELIPELKAAATLQRQDPRIIHFAYRKPWRRWGLPGSDRWWRHARKAGLGPHYALQFIVSRARIELATLRRKISGRLKKRTS
jgi:lipopolysaccharide biosynthesis glycosyltransferase